MLSFHYSRHPWQILDVSLRFSGVFKTYAPFAQHVCRQTHVNLSQQTIIRWALLHVYIPTFILTSMHTHIDRTDESKREEQRDKSKTTISVYPDMNLCRCLCVPIAVLVATSSAWTARITVSVRAASTTGQMTPIFEAQSTRSPTLATSWTAERFWATSFGGSYPLT